MSAVKNLIDALALCLPQFSSQPMLENPPDDPNDPDVFLGWLTDHLRKQNLLDYREWKEYFGELPDLLPLKNLNFSAFKESFVWDVMEETSCYPIFPVEAPFLEYINSFLVSHGLRLGVFAPFENGYILCVKDDSKAIDQLNAALREFDMMFYAHDVLDEHGVREYIENEFIEL